MKLPSPISSPLERGNRAAFQKRPAVQQGQAMTEFVVIALALIPLFLMFPVIGKYQDIAHNVQLASRYAAFDALNRNDVSSSWKPEGQLAEEVRRRFFGDPEAPIRTGDGAEDYDYAAHQNLFWRKPNGESLIEDPQNDVKLGFGDKDSQNHDDAFTAAADGRPFPLHDSFDLRARGIYTASISVTLANLPSGLKSYEPFDRINLALLRSTSVIIDPWMAAGPRQAELRFGGNDQIFPAAALRTAGTPVDAAVGVIDLPGGLRAPQIGALEFWRDAVPNDRLK